MNMDGPHPPAPAIWLLEHLCPGNNKEALAGDLIEKFREGRSDGWFWQQVLIAILVGVLTELRLRWPQICHAVAGTVLLVLLRNPINRLVMVPLWVSSRGLLWPLSSASYTLGHAAILALAVLPVLAALLLVQRKFGWTGILRAFGIGFLLIAVGDLVTVLWLLNHPVTTYQQQLMVNAFGISRIFCALLASAWWSGRLPSSSIS